MKATEENYREKSNSFMEGITLRSSRVIGEVKTIDKELAESTINKLIAEGRKVESAECGLLTDWACTRFPVFEDNEFSYEVGSGFDHSDWAIPALIVYFVDDTNEMYHCFNSVS
jgi:hypothetical protein